MMNRNILYCLFFWSLSLVMSAGATTFYVAISGSDDHLGTEDQPWGSLQHAVEMAGPGDTVRVGPGVYEETVFSTRPGTENARIVFDGRSEAQVNRFRIRHAYITLTGFTVTGADGSSAIDLEDGAHYTILTNNLIDTQTNLGVRGVFMVRESFERPDDTDAPSHCLIISNTFRHVFGSTALTLAGRHNMVRENVFEDVFSADFLRLFGHANVIQRNVFQRNFLREGTGYHPDFVQTLGENRHSSLGHIIDSNIVRDMQAQVTQLTMVNSFDAGQHGDWTFSNNLFINITHSASVGIPNTKWYNNLFYRVATDGGNVLALSYNEGRSNAEGAVVLNNIFLDCGLIDRNNSGWYTRGITNLVADHNFVAKNEYAPVRQENPPSRFRWYEENGINGGNPNFVNEALHDFRLRADSLLIGKGKPIPGLHHDFDGGLRPAGTSDIGPFQFAGGGPPAPSPGTPQNLSLIQ